MPDVDGVLVGPLPVASSDYCGSTGTFTLSGQFRRGQYLTIPHENAALTLFVKRCTGPEKLPCAHPSPSIPTIPGGTYCSDGAIEVVTLQTDCNGNYSVTVEGCVLAVGLAIGNWIANPRFSCSTPPPLGSPTYTDWLLYIRDPTTLAKYGCEKDILGSGTALTIGDLYPNETAGPTDASQVNGACGYEATPPICYACQLTDGCFYLTRPTAVMVTTLPDGSVQFAPQALNGSYTLDFWDNTYHAGLLTYYTLDGKNYMVGGVNVHLTDACGLTETVTSFSYPGIAGIHTVDWSNITAVTVSNWPGDCNPPLYITFAGPEGPLFVSGPLAGPPGPVLPVQDAQLYPVLADLSQFCIDSSLTFGVKLQVCTGTVPDRLQADCYRDVLAVAWISSGVLKTACHRAPTRSIGSATQNWEAAQTLETANADDIGMIFLPNESLYLCYLLSGVAKYRLNQSFGANGAWGAALSPLPVVARHSASGRGQEQAFRFRALGTQTTNGVLEFSQCRDNRGVEWTAPTAVTMQAQGPYCGGVWLENGYGCLYSLATNVVGVGAAGDLMWTESTDGGVTWSAPVFTGYTGQCNGIVRTHQGILVAVVQLLTPETGGLYGTRFLQSRNGGKGWSSDFAYGYAVPGLPRPPFLAAMEDAVFVVWVTGDQPQFLASLDGGVSWW